MKYRGLKNFKIKNCENFGIVQSCDRLEVLPNIEGSLPAIVKRESDGSLVITFDKGDQSLRNLKLQILSTNCIKIS